MTDTSRPQLGFPGVEEGPDPVVGEVPEPERCPLDAFDQVAKGFEWVVEPL